MRNSKGKQLGHFDFGKKERYVEEHMMVPRQEVHQALMDMVDLCVQYNVQYGKKAKEIRETDEGVEVEFEDGKVEKADLLVGADGVRSAVRRVIGNDFGCETEAVFSDLVGVGGFVEMDKVPEFIRDSLKEDPTVMTFGRNGFFGYSPVRPFQDGEPHGLLQWWSTVESKTVPNRDTPVSEIREQLLKRHGGWQDPSGARSFTDLINKTIDGQSKVLILPEFTAPRLPSYASKSGRVILVGDAAHAMPPHSGQGVSTALEDAKALSLLLKHNIEKSDQEISCNLASLGQQYTKIRKPRIDRILDVAARNGDTKRELGWLGEKFRDVFIWLACRLTGPGWVDEICRYDIEEEVQKVVQ